MANVNTQNAVSAPGSIFSPEYIRQYNGYKLQGYLLDNIDLVGYAAAFYLVFVAKGDTILGWFFNKRASSSKHSSIAKQLRIFYAASAALHLVTVVASGLAAFTLVTRLLQSIEATSLYTTACTWTDALLYTGPVGYWNSVVIYLKLAELLDTVLLVVRNFILEKYSLLRASHAIQPVHWWYRPLIALYLWNTYSVGITTITFFTAATAAFHTFLNAYYLTQDLHYLVRLAGSGSGASRDGTSALEYTSQQPLLLKGLGVLASLTQMGECVVCIALAVYSSYMNYTAPQGCLTMQANVRMCVALYASTLVLLLKRSSSSAATTKKAADKKKNK